MNATILSQHINFFQSHVFRLYENGVISDTKRDKLLLAMDHVCHQLNKGNADTAFISLYKHYKKHGSPSLNAYFDLINVAADNLGIYNEVFVPISVKTIDACEAFSIVRHTTDIDCLCDTEAIIRVTVNEKHYEFEGFIDMDPLNIIARTNEQINSIKTQIKQIVDCPADFVKQWFKLAKCSILLTHSIKEAAEKIQDDYAFLKDLSKKTVAEMMPGFIKGTVRIMYRYIHTLLLSPENANDAAFLYSIINSKEITDKSMAKCVYHNLSFRQRVKLNKALAETVNIIKTIKVPKTVPIETKLASLSNMPDYVKSYIIEKQSELKTENAAKASLAIEGLLKFPWKPKHIEQISNPKQYLDNVKTKLDQSVYGHFESKRAFTQLVAKWIKNPHSTGQVIGLVGPPGIGKTLMAKAIANALDLPIGIICLGGMEDPVDLIGHSSTYVSAQYGLIIRQMIKNGAWRSILFFDEVDKVSRRHQASEIHNILIHLTDPNTNTQFNDRFYSTAIDFDLSGTLIIFSYNDSSLLHPILLDRITEIKLSPFSLSERIEIVNKHMLPELIKSIGLHNVTISNDVISYLVHNYTKEAGVRSLKRLLEQILMRLNYESVYEKIQTEITKDVAIEYIDITPYVSESVHPIDQVGVVLGMYATTLGLGGILSIQVFENHYKDERLKITGNQKKVMTESIECALTAALNVLSKAERKDTSVLFPHGFHVHVPDAASPKDGPSAGCAFATAFVSLITNKPVNRLVAITGEIDLLGNVKAIGGLEEKLWGAKAAGVTHAIIPFENMADYDKIKQKHVDLDLVVVPVNHLKQVIEKVM